MGIRLSYLCLIVVALTLVSGQSTSSINYTSDIITSSGGGDISSSNYGNEIVVGTVTGSSSSSLYTNLIGFFFGSGASVVGEINNAPNYPAVSLTSSDGSNYSNQDLICGATISDPDNDSLDVAVKWYKDSSLDSTTSFDNGYVNGTSFTHSLASSSTSTGDVWFCSIRLYDKQAYSGWGNSSNLTVLETLAVVLETPDAGGGIGAVSVANISIVPTELNIDLIVNRNIESKITITNLENNSVIVRIGEENLDQMIIFTETIIMLGPLESKEIGIVFVAQNQTGIFTGKILIGNKEVLVSLNIRTVLLLFDSNIIVLNKDYKVIQGESLKTKITLIPMGDKERMDVTLNYIVKDYSGKIYLTKSETLLITEQVNFERSFGTGALPTGRYVVGLELIYPNGVAPSSAHFEVTRKIPIEVLTTLNIYSAAGILLILILIILIREILKNKKKGKRIHKKKRKKK